MGDHPAQALAVSARGATVFEFHRHLSPERQVLRGAGGVCVARGEPARRLVPGRLFRVERAAQARPGRRDGGSPENARGASSRPRASSYSEEPGRRGPGVAPRVDHRNQQARAARAFPRDDREHHAVHRPLRHRVGDHGRVPGDRRRGVDEPRRRRARHRGSADCDGRRPLRGDPGCLFLQPLRASREGVHRRDG